MPIIENIFFLHSNHFTGNNILLHSSDEPYSASKIHRFLLVNYISEILCVFVGFDVCWDNLVAM